ncbi:MAG TPA: hypothetical protein VNS63_25115 [Blastocatellia bacterium]|nr:hypothetical protein [Blastocatellia bacterium]
MQERAVDEEASRWAIKQLWSADQGEREAAKVNLLRLNQKAIPQLIALLRDIESDPRPRYAPGREDDVVEAEARYRALLKSGKTEESREALDDLMNIRITWRLKKDVCELLGRLHAEEAIPALIDAMVSQDSVGSWETMSPQMQALMDIGAPAVVKLIEAIETAEQRADAIEFKDEPIFTEEARRRIAKIQVFQTKARACMVLGEIGDGRALPALEKLLSETDDPILSPYIIEGLKKIRAKAN